MCQTILDNASFYRTHASVKRETAINGFALFPNIEKLVSLDAKSVQVSCVNRLFNGYGFHNDAGGMEFYSDASKQCFIDSMDEVISQLRSQLSETKTKLVAEQYIFNEGSGHINEWTDELFHHSEELSRLNTDLLLLAEKGKSGAIEDSLREHQRNVLLKKIPKMRSKVYSVKRKINAYKSSYRKILRLNALIVEMENDITDKENIKSTFSTFTVEKNGITSFPFVANRKQKTVCVFANVLDYCSYLFMINEGGFNELPKSCDCIVMNDPENFMKMLVSVDTYDYIFCFFPNTILYKSIEETIIQRDAPRAVSMGRYFNGFASLYTYMSSLSNEYHVVENN